MKVSELIEQLAKMPPDSEVRVVNETGNGDSLAKRVVLEGRDTHICFEDYALGYPDVDY